MAIIDSVNGRAPRADTLFSAGTVAVTMGWRGLLRVVDFQALLSSQPLVASALDKAQHAGGTRSPEAKALREGYHLLAKVLWTRRASIRRIHDLAWLDHTVVSAGGRPRRGLGNSHGGPSIPAAGGGPPPGGSPGLLPPEGSNLSEGPGQTLSGINPNVQLEQGVSD